MLLQFAKPSRRLFLCRRILQNRFDDSFYIIAICKTIPTTPFVPSHFAKLLRRLFSCCCNLRNRFENPFCGFANCNDAMLILCNRKYHTRRRKMISKYKMRYMLPKRQTLCTVRHRGAIIIV